MKAEGTRQAEYGDKCPACGGYRNSPCEDCGKLRSKDEGGTIFTVCDECWEKRKKAEREQIGKLFDSYRKTGHLNRTVTEWLIDNLLKGEIPNYSLKDVTHEIMLKQQHFIELLKK